MKKINTSALIILGIIFVSLSSLGSPKNDTDSIKKLPFVKSSDRDGMYHAKSDGTPLYCKKNRFKKIGDFVIDGNDTLAWVENFDEKFFHIRPNGKAAYVEQYVYVGDYINHYAVAQDDLGSFHIKKNGKRLYGKIYDDARPFHDGLAAVENVHGDVFFIDTTGFQPATWSKEKYLMVGDFINGCTWVKDHNGRFFLKNKLGEKILGDNTTYKSIIPDPNERGRYIAKNDSMTFILIIKQDNSVQVILDEKPKRKKN